MGAPPPFSHRSGGDFVRVCNKGRGSGEKARYDGDAPID
ncbi:hypothetical protein NT01EI_2083 [Edwardsiella ictaluri 93-146]|uniref:Uncharacterized protein n=1 Tax=Edwardsiella ictaluri (strain 93-146) TaxID=634503 RepID=C5BDE2_EDWI9|nr:hypothetical protein NT01EI_2083 [Edwardsiella ictaluri 93-146]